LLILIIAIVVGLAASKEMRTSRFQSREISKFAQTLSYELKPGPSDAIHYPGAGPFDLRLGYSSLGEFLPRLLKRDFVIEAQTRFSPALMNYTDRACSCPIPRKSRRGYRLPIAAPRRCTSTTIRNNSIPALPRSRRWWSTACCLSRTAFCSTPDNPWPTCRGLAALRHGGLVPGCQVAARTRPVRRWQYSGHAAGKYRHSPDGLTVNGAEKIRQMISASVRAYQAGPQTLEARQNIVRDYLNSVPLSAVPGHGEVHGMAEGLRVWYGSDFNQANEALTSTATDPQTMAAKGLALREMLSLMIAQRRPSHYLTKGRDELADLTDSHIRLLAQNGVIDAPFAAAALASKVTYRDWATQPTIQPIETNKGISVARSRLADAQSPAVRPRPPRPVGHQHPAGELQTQATEYLKNSPTRRSPRRSA
jgi:hypothetical protein